MAADAVARLSRPRETSAVTDDVAPELAHRRRTMRVVAGVALAVLAGLLALQMTGAPLAGLGAALGAGIVGFTLWGRMVVRPEGISYGRAAGLGFVALFAAFFGAALLGAAVTRPVAGDEAIPVAVFALMVVSPVMIAAAVALAFLSRPRT